MTKLKNILLGVSDVADHVDNIEDLSKSAYNMATDLIATLDAI